MNYVKGGGEVEPKLKAFDRSAHFYFLSVWARPHSDFVVGYATPLHKNLFYDWILKKVTNKFK